MGHPVLAMSVDGVGALGLLLAWHARLVPPTTVAIGVAALLLVLAPLLLFSASD
ncbi:MAG: hypothetical protein LC624_06655 [Halobacteriales archaeon]|nr:hypothetical protein [Halobacteriales archaeon]